MNTASTTLVCFPYDFDYQVNNGKTYLCLFSKTGNNEHVCVIYEYLPFFYAKIKPLILMDSFKTIEVQNGGQLGKIISVTEVEKEFLGKPTAFWKVTVNYPKAVPLIARELQLRGMETYEKDILFIHRALRDLNIVPLQKMVAGGRFMDMAELSGITENFRAKDFETQDSKYFLANRITPQEGTTSWKILAVDIETYAEKKEIDPEKNPILMIGLSGIDGRGKEQQTKEEVDKPTVEFQKVITWKKFPHDLPYVEHVADEKAMLERFQQLLQEYKPEILVGYFSDGFDLPYLKTRGSKHHLNFDFQVFSKTGFRSSEVKVKGMIHLDMLKFIKQIFGLNLKTDTYTLDAVAQELLGHSKHKVNLDNLAKIWDNEPEKLAQYCAYNLHDALLTRQLCEKLLSDIIEFTSLLGLPPFDVTRMRFSKLVENYILKRAIEFNIVAPNKAEGAEMEERREKSIEGAFVFQPTPGLYQDIAVFDFRSLYPTIITAHNLSPESFRCSCCQDKDHVPGKEEYWFCQREKKFLPGILNDIVAKRALIKKQLQKEKAEEAKRKNGEERKEIKKKEEDGEKEPADSLSVLEARTYALKILANSFYGYLGFFGARWYSLESAASTTAYARHYIKATMEKARVQGLEILYGDTDSLFLLLGKKTIDDAKKFMEDINGSLPEQMELEFEGYYPHGIFVSLKSAEKNADKSSDIGAKKKYALIRSNGTLKITGFESVRRNWSWLAKEVQEKVLQLVLENKVDAALKYVKKTIAELKAGNTELQKLIIRTQITRELHQYTSFGPHVLVAKKLEEKGERIAPGRVVEYVIAAGTGLVRDRATFPGEVKSYDSDYYVNHQLLPAVSSIFNVLGYSEEELLGKGKQAGLSHWI